MVVPKLMGSSGNYTRSPAKKQKICWEPTQDRRLKGDRAASEKLMDAAEECSAYPCLIVLDGANDRRFILEMGIIRLCAVLVPSR